MLTPASHEEVIDWLDAHLHALPGETVAVADTAGRVTGASIAAPGDHPPAAAAAVDGFALSAHVTVGASEYNPLMLRVADEGSGEPDQARQVVSGEALPTGADAVMPIVDADLRDGVLEIYGPVAAGGHVIPAGREARGGDRIVEAGRALRPVDLCLAAEVGIETLEVVRRPRVGLVSLHRRKTGQGVDPGRAMIRALVEHDGGIVQHEAPDGVPFAQRDVDLFLVLGGTGFGPDDEAVEALRSAGELAFRGVAINPGETASAGLVEGTPAILLPGPPLAAWFAYELLAGRAVRRLGGRGHVLPYGTRCATLARKVSSGLGRLECCRVRLAGDRAEPLAVADNRTLSTAVRADGFVTVPSHSEGFPEGAEITVYLYDQRY